MGTSTKSVVCALVFLLTPSGGPLRAQTAGPDTVALDAVADLASVGRTVEARVLLLRWWDEVRPDASRADVQRGLWLRGRLTVDPDQADLDFRRLVVRYPGGTYSDRALLRLAQAAHDAGNGEQAQRLVAQLLRDYPDGSVGRQARTWLAGAGPAPAPVAADGTSEPMIHPTRDPVRPDPGSRDPESAERTDSVAPTPPTPPPPVSQPEPEADSETPAVISGDYAVQLGAFISSSRAQALSARLGEAGFDPRLVRVEGSRLIHVRVGRFDSFQDAGDLLSAMRAAGFTAALVRDATQERSVR